MSKTLSASNIPGHTHSIPAHTHQVPSHGHTASSGSSGTHKHRYGNEGWGVYGTTDTAYKYKSDSYNGNLSGSGYKLIRLPESESCYIKCWFSFS